MSRKKKKKKEKDKGKKWDSLPNEFHRYHRWQRQNVVESKKRYRRRPKHRKREEE